MYPPVINHPKETQHIRDIADQYFGGYSEANLPTTASEDFSYFLQRKPGAYFVLGAKRKENETCHSSTYDFNDQVLATGAYFWVRLVEHRLKVQIL
jgi:hippurate hydrolase